MPLPLDISRLYAVRDEYPSNLGPKITRMHYSALDRYQTMLKTIDPDLFVQTEEEVEVRFRDLGCEGKGARRNCPASFVTRGLNNPY